MVTILGYAVLGILAFAFMHWIDADEVMQLCYPVVLVMTVIACRL